MLKKNLFFLGGEAGVGKSTIAKIISNLLEDSIIIDKDESTSFLAEAILECYDRKKNDRESELYLKLIKLLEYKQLDSIVFNGIKNTSMIVTASFFDSFLNKKWLKSMKDLEPLHNINVFFIILTRPSDLIQSGLIARGEYRDEWKIANYLEYRKNTDKILEKILENKALKHFHIDSGLAVDQLLQYIKNNIFN